MNPLVVIPARGGSKGLSGKNIKVLNGKPLICHTIEAARKVFEDESIIVSTDSNEIKNYRLARTIISKQNNFVHPEILPIEIELLNFLFPDRQDIIYNHEKECWLFKLDGIEIETKDHKELFVLLKQYYFKK